MAVNTSFSHPITKRRKLSDQTKLVQLMFEPE